MTAKTESIAKRYLAASARTNPPRKQGKNLSVYQVELLHGAIGLSTESGEILDALKKHLYYGAELDIVNLKEELGDICWYMALMFRELDSSFEEVMAININKLKQRFPERFDEAQALNRDLAKERKVLEDGAKPKPIEKPEDVSAQTWTDFLRHRKKGKAELTLTALNGLRSEAKKANMRLEDVLQLCLTQGWRGFRADWLKPSQPKIEGKNYGNSGAIGD